MNNGTETFPHTIIPNQLEMPTYEDRQETHMLLKANAASVQSELCGRTHGLLCLVLSSAVYQTITGSAFVALLNPGRFTNIPNGTTAARINEAVRNHKEELCIWQEYINIVIILFGNAELQKQRMHLIPPLLRILLHSQLTRQQCSD